MLIRRILLCLIKLWSYELTTFLLLPLLREREKEMGVEEGGGGGGGMGEAVTTHIHTKQTNQTTNKESRNTKPETGGRGCSGVGEQRDTM